MMTLNLIQQGINSPTSISVGAASILFLLYWFIAHSDGYRKWLHNFLKEQHVAHFFPLYQKGLGILVIGVAPAIILYSFHTVFNGDYGIELKHLNLTLIWIASLAIPLSFIPFFSARKEVMLAYYPQVRIKKWGFKLLLLNALVWAVYLFAYEFLFRSFLLKTLMISHDVVTAVTITTAISVITHMPKGATETFGTIPFSIVLCIAAISTGSIWAGFAIHLTLALSNDYWALHYHPDISYERSSRSYESI